MAGHSSPRTCSFEDCTKKHDSHSYCAVHARQYRKYGHPLSKAEKTANLSAAAKDRHLKYGHPNTGKKWSVKDTSRMKGHHPKSEFKKGCKTWNTGLSGWMSESHKKAILEANSIIPGRSKGKGLGRRPWNKIGDGITSQDKLMRQKFQKTMQRSVFERDDYTCQMCEQHGGYLQVDHIKGWAKHPDLRFETDNCRTLCMACHYYITFKRKMPEGIIWGHNLSRRIAS